MSFLTTAFSKALTKTKEHPILAGVGALGLVAGGIGLGMFGIPALETAGEAIKGIGSNNVHSIALAFANSAMDASTTISASHIATNAATHGLAERAPLASHFINDHADAIANIVGLAVGAGVFLSEAMGARQSPAPAPKP